MSWTSNTKIFETEEETRNFATHLAPLLRPGDVILLVGDIGAGKSFLSRAIIRFFLGEGAEVPSPTFTLVQTYETHNFEIWHCDLYRLSSPDEIIELGLTEAFDDEVCLIEWPDRLGDDLPKNALTIEMSATAAGHTATLLSQNQDWEMRFKDVFHD